MTSLPPREVFTSIELNGVRRRLGEWWRADIERGIEARLLNEWIRIGGDCSYNEVRRDMKSGDRLNSGFVPGRSQANGAVPVAVTAIFIDVRAQYGARQQDENRKRKHRPAKMHAPELVSRLH